MIFVCNERSCGSRALWGRICTDYECAHPARCSATKTCCGNLPCNARVYASDKDDMLSSMVSGTRFKSVSNLCEALTIMICSENASISVLNAVFAQNVLLWVLTHILTDIITIGEGSFWFTTSSSRRHVLCKIYKTPDPISREAILSAYLDSFHIFRIECYVCPYLVSRTSSWSCGVSECRWLLGDC